MERFWARVERTDGCWLWRGAVSSHGYGVVWFRGRLWRAHRVAWTLERGEIPDGVAVLHHCDTPLCVRPAHLFLGDQAANMADMATKRTVCHNGHPWTPDNIYRWRAKRFCRVCRAAAKRRWYEQRVAH